MIATRGAVIPAAVGVDIGCGMIAQGYAAENRRQMMQRTLAAIENALGCPFSVDTEAVNCHHNYVAPERHFGSEVLVTRKGAVRAREGDLGIIPGSMGARSYIVRGKGNPESFCSCAHGAGRLMSRKEARRRFTVEITKRRPSSWSAGKMKA